MCSAAFDREFSRQMGRYLVGSEGIFLGLGISTRLEFFYEVRKTRLEKM